MTYLTINIIKFEFKNSTIKIGTKKATNLKQLPIVYIVHIAHITRSHLNKKKFFN